MFTCLSKVEGLPKTWELKSSFGNITYDVKSNANKTLEELNINANTLLIVQEV